MFIYHYLSTLVLKSPNGEWPTTYTFIHLHLHLIRFKIVSLVALPKADVATKQLFDEVKHDILNDQNRGLCYLPKPSASADNTDTRF